MAIKKFFWLCANHRHSSHFKTNILLHFVHANEDSEDD